MSLRKLGKYLFYPVEFALVSCVVILIFTLPFTWSSNLGSWLGGLLGPLFPVNRIARRNLDLALPSLSAVEKKSIIKSMWQNLGRTFFEYGKLVHQPLFTQDSPYTIEGLEHLDALIAENKPGLLFSAHLGNWEVGTYVAQKRGLKLAQITRFLNNPLVRFLVNGVHGKIAQDIIPKGSEGAKLILAVLKKGGHVSMLADQKMNDGESALFFGRPAMTAPAFARLSAKFECPLVPFRVMRQEGHRCKVIFYPPLKNSDGLSASEQATDLLRQMNACIENWIRETPGQWFWIHRRWPKELYEG
jgi:KDO2-lipid IV(A) lauroyltransferase